MESALPNQQQDGCRERGSIDLADCWLLSSFASLPGRVFGFLEGLELGFVQGEGAFVGRVGVLGGGLVGAWGGLGVGGGEAGAA